MKCNLSSNFYDFCLNFCKDCLRIIPGTLFTTELYDKWLRVLDEDEEKVTEIKRWLYANHNKHEHREGVQVVTHTKVRIRREVDFSTPTECWYGVIDHRTLPECHIDGAETHWSQRHAIRTVLCCSHWQPVNANYMENYVYLKSWHQTSTFAWIHTLNVFCFIVWLLPWDIILSLYLIR